MKKLLSLLSNTILFVTLSLSPLLSFSQSESLAGKWSAGLHFAPEYSYRSLQSGNDWQSTVEYRDSTEIPSFGFCTGAFFQYRLNKKISFETGLNISDRHYSSEYIDLVMEEDEELRQVKNSHHFYYLSLPVKGNYNLYEGRASIYLTATVSFDVYLLGRNVSHLKYADGHVDRNTNRMRSDLSFFNMSGSVGAGVSLPLNERLSIRFEPTYRRTFFPLLDAPVREFSYSFGLDTGVSYCFSPR
jgi:hypothetical protein